MATFPSRHGRRKGKKDYGWQRSDNTVARAANQRQMSKQQERQQKKKLVLQQGKQMAAQKKLNAQQIKVVGVIALQQNLQPVQFLQKVYQQNGAEMKPFLDQQDLNVVKSASGQLLVFVEATSLDQCFSLDVIVYLTIDGQKTANQELVQQVDDMKLNQLPSLTLYVEREEYLQFLLGAGPGQAGRPPGAAGRAQTNSQQHVAFSPHSRGCYLRLDGALLAAPLDGVPWMRRRLRLHVLRAAAERADGRLALTLLGQARGGFSFADQQLYLTGFGDQLAVERAEVCRYDFAGNALAAARAAPAGPTDRNTQYRSRMAAGGRDVAPPAGRAGPAEPPTAGAQCDPADPSWQDVAAGDQTDISSAVDDRPIQLDYEFKRAQFKSAREQVEYPDELDINPQTSLRRLLADYFSLRSVRTSGVPDAAGRACQHELDCLYNIQQPTQVEAAFVDQQGSDLEPGGNNFLVLRLAVDYQLENNYRCMLDNVMRNINQNTALVDPDAVLQQLHFQCFENVPLRGQSLIGLFQHETKMGLCHCRVQQALQNQAQQFIYNAYTPHIIQLGFRRLYTIPTPYLQVADYRGKLLRYYSNNADFTVSFVAPIFISKLTYPPVVMYSDKRKYDMSETGSSDTGTAQVVLCAKIVQYNTQVQILERIILTGWPWRIHRNRSVIRYMFFNQPDVKYFINQYLTTRNGLNGKILSPMTEKGYFKAHFDGQLTSGDCVEMKLYKLMGGSGLAMSCVYEMCDGLNIQGYQAFQDLFDRFRSMIEQVLKRLRDEIIE